MPSQFAIRMGALVAIFSIAFSFTFFGQGKIVLGIVCLLPLLVLLGLTVPWILRLMEARRAFRSEYGKPARSPLADNSKVRRAAWLAGAAATTFALPTAAGCVAVLIFAFPAEDLIFARIFFVLSAVMLAWLAVGLFSSAVRLFRFQWQGAAVANGLLRFLLIPVGLVAAGAVWATIQNFLFWPYLLFVAAVVGILIAAIDLQGRALRALAGS